jgi:hypothetical protein
MRIKDKDVNGTIKKFFTTPRVDRFMELIQQRQATDAVGTVLSALGKTTDYEMTSMSCCKCCVTVFLLHIYFTCFTDCRFSFEKMRVKMW